MFRTIRAASCCLALSTALLPAATRAQDPAADLETLVQGAFATNLEDGINPDGLDLISYQAADGQYYFVSDADKGSWETTGSGMCIDWQDGRRSCFDYGEASGDGSFLAATGDGIALTIRRLDSAPAAGSSAAMGPGVGLIEITGGPNHLYVASTDGSFMAGELVDSGEWYVAGEQVCYLHKGDSEPVCDALHPGDEGDLERRSETGEVIVMHRIF